MVRVKSQGRHVFTFVFFPSVKSERQHLSFTNFIYLNTTNIKVNISTLSYIYIFSKTRTFSSKKQININFEETMLHRLLSYISPPILCSSCSRHSGKRPDRHQHRRHSYFHRFHIHTFTGIACLSSI